jgi:hypothetical protein
MIIPICFSILVLNVLKQTKHLTFSSKKNTQVFLLKSFVKVTKYFDLENDRVENEPQRFVWTNSNTSLAPDWECLGIAIYDYLPTMQSAQILKLTFASLKNPIARVFTFIV